MDARRQLMEDSNRYVMGTYKRYSITLRKGRGMKVWGADGKEYLDFVGGIAVNVLGHCHPRVVIAVQKQVQRLMHVSNLYHIEPQVKLAKLLVEHSFASRVFFSNSGAEANEAAIKLARKYAREHGGQGRHEIVTAIHSFHGRTLGTLAATGQAKFREPFEPLVPGFSHVPFGEAEAMAKAVGQKTCAVMLEPIQGEAGVRMPPPDYLREVRRICTERGALLILDEVQTGMGRTGTLFAHEQFGITPDIMTLAKGLGGGFPIGATLATEEVASAFAPGDHGSTFGGNPVAAAAGLATLQTVLDSGFVLDQCRRMGAYLEKKLLYLKGEFPSLVADVRGMGLLRAMELTRECAPVVSACMDRGLLVNCTAGNVVRLMPPLIVQEEDIDKMTDIMEAALERLA